MAVILNKSGHDLHLVPYDQQGVYIGSGSKWYYSEPIISTNYARYVNAEDTQELNFDLAVFLLNANFPKNVTFGVSLSAWKIGISASWTVHKPMCDLIIGPHDSALVYSENNDLKIRIDDSLNVKNDMLIGW